MVVLMENNTSVKETNTEEVIVAKTIIIIATSVNYLAAR